jgi:hypothetical protein
MTVLQIPARKEDPATNAGSFYVLAEYEDPMPDDAFAKRWLPRCVLRVTAELIERGVLADRVHLPVGGDPRFDLNRLAKRPTGALRVRSSRGGAGGCPVGRSKPDASGGRGSAAVTATRMRAHGFRPFASRARPSAIAMKATAGRQ